MRAGEARAPYRACVVRGWNPAIVQTIPMSIREPLPHIPIPLRAGDPEAKLDLQALLRRAYADGDCDDTDYSKPPAPPLALEDEAWADALLRAAGRR
jgi:hypothetical protein